MFKTTYLSDYFHVNGEFIRNKKEETELKFIKPINVSQNKKTHQDKQKITIKIWAILIFINFKILLVNLL